MRLDGTWDTDPAGVARPVVRGAVRDADGRPVPVSLLVDTGADRTVFDHRAVAGLGGAFAPAGVSLAGVGGEAAAVLVPGPLVLATAAGATVTLNGPFLGFPDPTGLGESVLGRDLLDHFAVILDRRAGVVRLLAGNHRYQITEG